MKATKETIKRAKDIGIKLENVNDLVELELSYELGEDATDTLKEITDAINEFKQNHPNAKFCFNFSDFEAYGADGCIEVDEITIYLEGHVPKTEEELLKDIKVFEEVTDRRENRIINDEKEEYKRLKTKFEGD